MIQPPAVDRSRTAIPVLTAGELATAWRSPAPVLCAAGRGPLDEAVAAMLVQLLGMHGLKGVEKAEAIASGGVGRLDPTGIVLVCLPATGRADSCG